MAYSDYESGPFCKHWNEVGSCSDCTAEVELGERATEALEHIGRRLDELSKDFYNHAYGGSDRGCHSVSCQARELLLVQAALTGKDEEAALGDFSNYLMKRGKH